MEQQRLMNQVEALRLAAERARVSAQLQAARMGLRFGPKGSLVGRTFRLLGRAVVKVFTYVCRPVS